MKRIINKNKFYFILFFLIVFGILTGCNGITLTPTIPEIDFFSADAPFLTEGNTTNLSWAVSNADTVTIDQGIGEVGLFGSHAVSPTENTTYTLTATSGAESETAEVTINVMPSYWEPPDWWGDINLPSLKKTEIIQPGPDEGKDSFVVSQFPVGNYANENHFMIGKVEGYTMRAYLQFDVSYLSFDTVIESAYLKLYQIDSYAGPKFNISVHSLTGGWEEEIINWNNQPYFWDAESTISVTPGNIGTWLSWDITALVQGWVDGNIINFGILLKKPSEDLGDDRIQCWASDYTDDPDLRPKLEITYYAP